MKSMLCTIYKSSREAELYLYVAKGSDLSQIPADLMARAGNLLEVMTLSLTEERKLARVNSKQVLEDIRDKGYFLQLPPNIHSQPVRYGK
ncbi:MAG: hypothetical protein CMP91_06470 [Gammaproteobacteria bacterium]|nr:hypothetical protein [Gammaproteobacteria bacterium]